VRLGRGPDQREVAEVDEEQVRRRVDGAQGPVDGDGAARRAPAVALRHDDLEDVAGADVVLADQDALDVLVHVEVGDRLAARHQRRHGLDALGQRAQQARRDVVGERLVARLRDHLHGGPHVVEGHDDGRDQERRGLREVAVLRRGQRHGRLEARDRVVAHEPDGAAGERRQAREVEHRALGEPGAQRREGVVARHRQVDPLAARRQERVAADLLAALDALEQEARPEVAQAQVGPDRRQQVGRQLAHGGAQPRRVLRSGCRGVHRVSGRFRTGNKKGPPSGEPGRSGSAVRVSARDPARAGATTTRRSGSSACAQGCQASPFLSTRQAPAW